MVESVGLEVITKRDWYARSESDGSATGAFYNRLVT